MARAAGHVERSEPFLRDCSRKSGNIQVHRWHIHQQLGIQILHQLIRGLSPDGIELVPDVQARSHPPWNHVACARLHFTAADGRDQSFRFTPTPLDL